MYAQSPEITKVIYTQPNSRTALVRMLEIQVSC
jgi:hypothetical protein